MSKHLIIESSLNPNSKSKLLAKEAQSYLKEAKTISLEDYNLPFCDGKTVYSNPNVQQLTQEIKSAKGVLLATPIYNYTINSALKNAIECTGQNAWSNKVVGFLVAAGGPGSYMAIMGIANSLMLDFRCIIVPRFVYALPGDFEENTLSNPEIKDRIKGLSETFSHFTDVL